jgi:poly(3-hydroxybutyrate) depolymerase
MLSLKVAFFAVLAEALVVPKSLSSISLEGCLKELPHGQSVGKVANVTITSGGLLRYFLISIPPTYHTEIPTPAILSYHGGLRTAEDQLQLDNLTLPEFNTNSFVVYPQGINVCVFNAWDCSQRQC